MGKIAALKLVNALLAVLIVTQAGSGFLSDEIGPNAFNIVHRGGAIVLLVCVAAHIALNWNWVKMVLGKRRS